MRFEQLGDWDGQGIVVHRDQASGSWFLIALHDTTLGPAAGGTRMRTYPDIGDAVVDAQRLAAGMTRKLAIAGLPFGGGKGVIAVPAVPTGPQRQELLLRWGELVQTLRGTFITATDIGTTPEDMDVVGQRTGSVMGRTERAGGSGSSGAPTARGVRHAMLAALDHAFGSSDPLGRTVAIQGLGSVGAHLAALLAGDGAQLILADVDGERAREVAASTPSGVVRYTCWS